MSEFKGTKGKWEINPKAIRNVRCGGITVANTSQGQSGDNEEEEQSNALLISKAPEMLEMLIELRKFGGNHGMPYDLYEELDKLIKEATTL